ncbi:MAG: hypothetical protein HY924_11395 [Elusimicrobia bacterium]|nr:hypothetical protein [Elusimicrobiota bacterium]
MRSLSSQVTALVFTVGTFVAPSLVLASTHPLGFEESFYGVFRQLYAPVEGFKASRHEAAPPVPYETLLEVSDAVLAASPAASRELAHLRKVSREDLVSGEGWEEFRRFEPALDRSFNRKGVFFSPGLRRKIYVVGAGLMWHQAQHQYDSQAPHIRAAEAAGGTPMQSIEAEMRAWRAACSFWNAGNDINLSMGGKPFADPFSCFEGFPKAYYCRHLTAAESVILTIYRVKLVSRMAGEPASPDGEEERRPDFAAAQAGLEAELAGFCAEFERSVRGNPLSLEGVRLEWGLQRCVDEAVAAVNTKGWKPSRELCPASGASGELAAGAGLDL